MGKTLRVAILGGGRMAQKHATAIRLQPGAGLVAVADPYLSEEEIQARFGTDIEGFRDIELMLEKQRPDIVHIVTPPHTHFPLAKLCLERGASVYVEKPFAPTAREAAHLIDLAESKNLRVCAALRCPPQRQPVMRPSQPSLWMPGRPERTLSVSSLPRPSVRKVRPGMSRRSVRNFVLPSAA